MQRSYKLILSIIVVILSGALAFAQEAAYKDVILDGKPAKLNLKTGEITLVDSEGKSKNIATSKHISDDKKEVEIDSDFHVVQENETLLDVANRYNTTLTELKRVNNLETTLVNEGQQLRVRNFDNIEPETDDMSPEPVLKETKNDYHIVEEGQTLYSLGIRYGLTVDELKRLNRLSSNIIKVGEKLRIANFSSNGEKGDLSVWTVSKGDTLYSIAKSNGLTVEQLKSLNGLTGNLIKVGQKLQLE
ncbi:LysM peptidoglycan-binding domain-containing protein [Winogradskyella sp.]|uniref:LysM peptidoglycan-binding domain-containing protein n=1 Tax=Winogradskyella sp. TaxID=1883156 RepID=UPI0035120134